MPNFSIRSTLPEKMDDASVPDGEVRKALRELEIINRWLGGYKVVLRALTNIHWPKEREVSIMDMGSGGGDMLRAVAKWAAGKQRRVRLIGVDMNPAMTRYAGNKSGNVPNLIFRTANVFDPSLDGDAPHIVMCSLFAHHFDHEALVALLKRMWSLAGTTVIINDLHRHPIAYYSIKALTKAFSRTDLVRYDAPLSVARSLKRREWITALFQAGITSFSIRWRWAWRWEIILNK